MRPIDADALEKEIKRVYCTGCNDYHGIRCRACETDDALDMIDDAPTIDAEPVRHGYWIGLEYDGYADGFPVYNLWECSECGNEHRGEDTPNYCSNCGSKMDLEVQDE